jgi:DNA-binding CsgD family transcriptional regulator
MPRNPTAPLTDSELDALRLAASGYTSRQIAHRLGTTERGIHLRIKAATAKLGARSRTHAVVIAIARELIQLEELELPDQRKAAA